MLFLEFVLYVIRENPSETIAFSALGLALYQGLLTRRHNRLVVRPHLSTFTHTNTETRGLQHLLKHEISLRNSGLGPAIISNYEVLLDGIAQDAETPDDIYKTVAKALDPTSLHDESFFVLYQNGAVIGKEEEKVIGLIVVRIHSRQGVKRIRDQFSRLHLVIKYKSAYGESIVFDSRKFLFKSKLKTQLLNRFMTWREYYRLWKAVG